MAKKRTRLLFCHFSTAESTVRICLWVLTCIRWLTFLTDFLLCYQLGTYENDFKMEREEKINALREKDRAIQNYEHLKKEHVGLRQNIERMYSQAQGQQQVHPNPLFVISFYLFMVDILKFYLKKI